MSFHQARVRVWGTSMRLRQAMSLTMRMGMLLFCCGGLGGLAGSGASKVA